MSQRQAAKAFNISRDTVWKMMSFSVPPGYRRTAEVRRPNLDPFITIIAGWLKADRSMPGSGGTRQSGWLTGCVTNAG